MPGFALLKGMAFDWNGAGFRIDRLQPNGDVLLERIADGHVIPATREHLLAEYAQGRVTAQSSNSASSATGVVPMYSRPLDELPTHVQAEVTRRRHYLQALLDSDGFVFTPAVMQPFITEVANRIGDPDPPGVTSLYRWYSRYRLHQDARALIPRTDRRGCRNLKQNGEILRLASEAMQEAFDASPQATGQTSTSG